MERESQLEVFPRFAPRTNHVDITPGTQLSLPFLLPFDRPCGSGPNDAMTTTETALITTQPHQQQGATGGEDESIMLNLRAEEEADGRRSQDEEDEPAAKRQRTTIEDTTTRKKRPSGHRRRGKKPAVKRRMQLEAETTKTAAGKGKQTRAPFNTTQFIMDDHGDTIQYLDKKLGVSAAASENNPSYGEPMRRRVSRARESSFSLDSDEGDGEDHFYSSPDDDGEFLCREFLKDYDSARADRLVAMAKGELISEYLQMESRIDALEKRLRRAHQQQQDDERQQPEAEVAERIRFFEREIQNLEVENQSLREETLVLRRQQEEQQQMREAEGEGTENETAAATLNEDTTASAEVTSSCSDNVAFHEVEADGSSSESDGEDSDSSSGSSSSSSSEDEGEDITSTSNH